MKKRNIRLFLLLSLLAMVHTAMAEGEHWTWNPNQYPNNAIFTAVITIDGEEQRSDQLEIGAFCEETCRGSVICEYEPRKDRYFAYLVVNGVNGMVMNFRLWDHATDTELDVTCDITYIYEENQSFGLPSDPFVFPFTTNPAQVGFVGTVNELWSVAGNWVGNALPTVGDIAVINAPCHLDQDAEVLQLVVSDNQSLTVMEGYTLTAGSIVSDVPSKLVVADGGQLVCDDVEGVYATIQKHVEGYGESTTDQWCFIASPLVSGVAHSAVEGLVNEEGYDLYSFDQTHELEWINFKSGNQTLNPGEGYLYANKSETTLNFAGELNSGVVNVPLEYLDGYILKGWNLIGNSNTYSVYANRSYYVLNESGNSLNPTPALQTSPIAPCTGIMVKAEGEGEEVIFSKTASKGSHGNLRLTVTSSDRATVTDCVIVSFDSGNALPKFVFSNNQPMLSIPQEGEEYAIAVVNRQDETALNFKAAREGSYTLCVCLNDLRLDYLHLIDNLTGDETDLLATPTYTFNACRSDYPSRFRLVFKAEENADECFAFFDGSKWMIDNDDEALLQLVDVTGQIVNTIQVSGRTSIYFNQPAGIYVLRLVSANEMKIQKIIIR